MITDSEFPSVASDLITALRERFPKPRLSALSELRDIHINVGHEQVIDFLASMSEHQRGTSHVP